MNWRAKWCAPNRRNWRSPPWRRRSTPGYGGAGRARPFMAVTAKRLAFFGVLVTLWLGLYATHIWSPLIFPSPADTWSSLVNGVTQGAVPAAIVASLRRVVIGYALSFVAGMVIGVAMARWKSVQQMVGPVVLGMQTLPSICWLPLALLWWGLDEKASITVVVLGSTFA